MDKLSVISVSLLLCVVGTHGLTMEPISLSEDRSYLQLHDTKPSVLQCNFIAEVGVAIETVTWFHDTSAPFSWNAPANGKVADGFKAQDFVINRKDGHLELKNVDMDSMGTYRCDVTTSKGETFKSPEYHLLVVDIPSSPVQSNVNVDNCVVKLTWSAPAINPKPSPVCGIYIPETNQYILTATSWQATPYYNGSIAYSLHDEKFEINQIPIKSILKCELGMTMAGGRYAQIYAESHNITEINERGCRPLELAYNIDIEYVNERTTCRSEMKPKNTNMPVKAMAKCKQGLVPKYSYLVTEVELQCTDETWTVVGGQTWNHFDNLICVEEDVVALLPKRPMQSSGTEHSTEQPTSSARMVVPYGILALFVLLGGYLLIWKLQFRKKNSRHMA